MRNDDDARKVAAGIALSMYAGEPCRICRRTLTVSDLKDAVFAGYSLDGKSRAAHRVCWENFVELLHTLPKEQLRELAEEEQP